MKKPTSLKGFAVTRNSWDQDFILLAQFWADRRSKDPSTKVGAVIVHPETRAIVSMGYNGFPKGVFDDPTLLENREEKYKRVIHAEANAILAAGHAARGMHLYGTLFPCNECAKLIISAGIRKVYTPPPPEGRCNNYDVSMDMLTRAGVHFYFVELP